MHDTFQDIIMRAREKGPTRLAFILPGKEEDIASILSATDIGLIHPLFIGTTEDCERILPAETHAGAACEVIDSADTDAVLSAALSLTKEGRADILMQGDSDQQLFFDAVCRSGNGLMEGKLLSCLAIFRSSPGSKGFIITDSYINNYPSLREKQEIVNQAIELSQILDIDTPKIAALAAIEQVNPKIQSTVDSAILSKMSERGQFGKAVIDGPIDIDCALSKVAARRKGLESMVTGDVDIYLVPDVESGYSFVETLVFIGRMSAISVLMGTTKPVILTMPFVLQKNRVAEIALASLISHAKNKQ